jgi:Icc-related predicted phosphoesterase
MRIVAITDVHGQVARLEQFAEVFGTADLVLIAGDLTQFGGTDDAERVLAAVRAHAPRVLAVPGNCDPPPVARYLHQQAVGLHGRHVLADGLTLVGLGGSLPCPGSTPNELSEAQMAAELEAAVEGVDAARPLLLVAHQPPYGTAVDVVQGGLHVGSSAVRSFIEMYLPLVCFCGHIHEASGTDTIGTTRILNPGPAAHGGYAVAEVDGRVAQTVEVRRLG